MHIKTVLFIKHDVTVRTIKSGFDPGSKISSCFVDSSTGRAILPFAVMVLGILCIVAFTAKTTIIRLIYKGGNTGETIKVLLWSEVILEFLQFLEPAGALGNTAS